MVSIEEEDTEEQEELDDDKDMIDAKISDVLFRQRMRRITVRVKRRFKGRPLPIRNCK